MNAHSPSAPKHRDRAAPVRSVQATADQYLQRDWDRPVRDLAGVTHRNVLLVILRTLAMVDKQCAGIRARRSNVLSGPDRSTRYLRSAATTMSELAAGTGRSRGPPGHQQRRRPALSRPSTRAAQVLRFRSAALVAPFRPRQSRNPEPVTVGRAGRPVRPLRRSRRRCRRCRSRGGRAEVSCTFDPAVAEARDEAFRNGQVPPPPEFPHLISGVLAGPADPLAGRLAPQGRARLDDRIGRFDDIHGVGWTLISAVPVDDVLSPEQQASLDKLGTRRVTIDVDADIDGYYASYFAENKVAAVPKRAGSNPSWPTGGRTAGSSSPATRWI